MSTGSACSLLLVAGGEQEEFSAAEWNGDDVPKAPPFGTFRIGVRPKRESFRDGNEDSGNIKISSWSPPARRSARRSASAGALLAITLQPADEGDTTTIHKTLQEAQQAAREIGETGVEEVVADKGYHSGSVLSGLHREELRSSHPRT